ncbi:MAG: SH3 domain-containing protein, partial [Synergistaceae bacterium]|nr:SH3 domain-containing protein [Synergistaceae bacterium]
APPQLSPTSGNIHNFRSAESGIALEIALSKARRKQQFKRQVVKNVIMAVIFLGVAGAGIHYGMKYLAKSPPPETPTANLFRVTKPEPVPEPVIPPVRITATKTTATPVVRSYSIQSGGVVTTDKAPCRSQPSSGSRATAVMRKDSVFTTTKEVRDKDGSIWYYVKNSQFEGWASGSHVRVYKY